ncbi:endonuclease MutS2 [Suicoccus acidiformans]|uniref:Endonuclease MutS2 n=1 Tax=Suicoccus acidiformans TaxID=2036206 RepID=A0A347WJT7_9LACT|nr:endonuclease MutS2 [Suicoccus acidiformans]AXY25344.1 endonuclease MutS2 [Suicoccus acidiformans]
MAQDKVYDILEFEKIQQAVADETQTEGGAALARRMKPTKNLRTLRYWQDETAQSLMLIQANQAMPIPRLNDVTVSLKRLTVGASLNGPEIAEIGRLLTSVRQVVQFFEQQAQEDKTYPALAHWVEQCVSLPEVSQAIRQALSEDGSVLTSASVELTRIRRQQSALENQVRDQLNQIVKKQGNILSDSIITIRNNRYVLPVKTDFSGQMPGTVHDQSSTGQTLYIEPQSVVQLNNRRSELQVAERREIERILFELSQQMMPYTDDISQNQRMLSRLDYIQARALYAQKIDATKPSFSQEQHVALWQARHPLLDPEDVVANDILLGEEYRALIITGPNTGGKTILLKTLGLLQLMGQSGLHIPAETGSQLGIFDAVYADIGDEQSIEQSLSTFSGHMTNIVSILERMTGQSLLLFDELGSGTDPQEGAALAMAILEYVRKRGVSVMATTHYPELKVYAHETPSTINASMEFNSETLSPTYRLLIGIPGRSNALDISERLGLPQEVLEMARSGVSRDDRSLNEMVANLERERREAEADHRQAEVRLEEAEQLYQDLYREYNRWLEQKQQIAVKAREEANEKVAQTQAEAERILSDIRDLQLEQGQANTIKEHTLIEKRSEFDELKQPAELRSNKVLKKAKRARQEEALQVGDDVEVTSYGQRGTIVEQLSQNEYVVQMGILKMKLPAEDLERIEKAETKQRVNVQRQAGSKVQTTLDIRGERYEDGLKRVGQYLDQALLSNHPMVTIIHGKGTGALRQGVQDLLRKHPQVERFEYSAPNAGGNGSTVVYFE